MTTVGQQQNKWRNETLDCVNISALVSKKENKDGKLALPLMVTPNGETSVDFISSWMKSNKTWLDDMMVKYGAVMFRGFDIDNAIDFEKTILAYEGTLNDTYRGTSPRNLIPGTKYVFSAADVPANYPIPQHLEMSFLPAPPKKLFFSCVVAPKTAGGETSLCDFRQVFRDLRPSLKAKLLSKKIQYTRTHRKVGSYWTFDVGDMLSWSAMFGTSDPAEVEQLCRDENVDMIWQGKDHEKVVMVSHSEAFQLHPISNEPVYFAHIQVFHWTSFPAELLYSFLRTYDLRILLHFLMVAVFCIINYGILGNKMSLDITFGDGTPISVWEMHELRTAIHQNTTFNRWQKGDFVCIDNFAVSHGRQPTFDMKRKIVVAWSDPLEKSNRLTSL